MRFRLVSYCSAALMASSAFIVPQALAAASSDGIVVYNAQHENLVKSWLTALPKRRELK